MSRKVREVPQKLNWSEGRKWGVKSVVVEFGVFGVRPIFRPEVPKPFKNWYLGPLN